MMADVTDERLQDYLDGRLCDKERAEVEAALGDDPDLARRLAAWREIGGALRSDDDELSPGFHTRARQRFEQTTRPRSRFGFRILSWEVAGLAAAALLAAVVFIPEMMRDPDPGRAPAVPAPAATFADEVAPLEDARDKTIETPETIREPMKQELRAEMEQEPAAAGHPSAAAPSETRERSRVQALSRVAAAPIPAEPEADAVEEVQQPRVVELPGAGGPPEGLSVLDTRPEWDAWLAGPAGPMLSELGKPDPAQRLVLVGRPAGLDCSSLRVTHLANGYSIRVSAGSSAGCALLLPRDGLPISLE